MQHENQLIIGCKNLKMEQVAVCFCCSFIPSLADCKSLKMEPGCFCFCFIPSRVFLLGSKNLKMEPGCFCFYPFQSVFARWQEFENGASDTFFFLPECFPCCSAGPPNHSSTVLVSYNLYKLALASDLKISVWVSCMQSFSKASVLPRNNSKFLRLCIHVQFMQGVRRLNTQRCVLSCLFMFRWLCLVTMGWILHFY